MAFWEKKSADPWDIDPEKRKKEREREQEKEARRQEREETPGLLDELKEWNENRKAKRAAEENMPSEKCPWCGKDMAKNYLTGGDGWLRLSEKRPHPLLGTAMDDNWAYLNDGNAMNRYKLAWYCRDCRKLVMDVQEEESGPNYTWEDGTPKFRKEEDDAYEQYREQVKKYQ